MHQLWILIYQQKLPLNRYQGSLQWGPQGVRLSSAAFHYDKMSKKSSSVIDDGTERNLSMVWSVTEENRYYNWTLVYFFLFLLKNGFSFRFFMFTILAWPISLHILMYLLFSLLRLRFIDMYTILKFLLKISLLQKSKSLKHITFNQIGLKKSC